MYCSSRSIRSPDAARGIAGGAELVFRRRGDATVLAHARASAPLKIIRPFPLGDGRLVVPLITIGPGLCGGDTCVIDVRADEGARAILTNTAATRVLSMHEREVATQRVRLTVASGASLEYYPGLTIPFPDSAFMQTLDVCVSPGGHVGILETWAFGRAARGEYLRFRLLRSRTLVHVQDALVHGDAIDLSPGLDPVQNAGVLERRRYLVSGFWYGAELGSDEPARSAAPPTSLVAFGQSNPRQVFLRALGDDGQALDAVVQDALARVARAWSVTPVRLERFRC